MIKDVKKDIKSSYSSEEFILIQAINAFNETTRAQNLIFERLSEWYGIYLPEVKASSPSVLAQLTLLMKDRDSISRETIAKILNDDQKAEIVHKKISSTMGRANISQEELKAIIAFANLSRRTEETLLELDEYIKGASNR